MIIRRAWSPLLLVSILSIPASTLLAVEPPPEVVVKQLTAAIRQACPEARFEIEDGERLVVRSTTMTYTIHNRSKTGEVFPQTYQSEGPTYRGFILELWQEAGPYEGAAAVPQEIQGPYFPTHMDAAPTPDGRGHRRVNFSYGRQLDEKLKQAILAALKDAGFASIPGME